MNIFGYNPNCTFRLGATEVGITDDAIVINLNKGQSYVLESPLNGTNAANRDGWIGASITSTKAIAVSVGQMHFQPRAAGTQDCAIDQIIPENTLGKEYIFVRANGINDLEFPVIIATQNDTKIYVNGSVTPIATINNGDYFAIPSTNYSLNSTTASVPGGNMYVRTSREAYAIQVLAGSSSDATADLNFIAPVNCLLANTVDNIPQVSNIAGIAITGGVTLIAAASINDANITITSAAGVVSTATLAAAKKTLAGTTEWKSYYLPGLTGDVTVAANGPIAVGYFGVSGVAGASGYFSGFETIPTIEVERIGNGCLPGTVLTASPGFTAYTWYKDGVVVPGVDSNSYTPAQAGKFTVTVSTGTCSFSSASQYIYDCNPEIIVNTTANKNGILTGETVIFTVSVRYLSDINADNLVLTNLVPSNVTVTGTSATYGSVTNTGSSYSWNIGTIRNGEEHLLYITATGNSVIVPTAGTLTVTKTQTITGTESNKVPDDFSETVTVYSALTSEPTDLPTGWYFTNTGSAHPYNNVLHFTPAVTADGYLVVRKSGAEPVFVPVDGTSYSVGPVGADEIIYVGNESPVTDWSASHSADYHYVIYPYKGGGAATNYLTLNPLTAVINNRITNGYAMSAMTKSTSAGFADQRVNVTFINGLGVGGSTLTATRIVDRPANSSHGLPAGLNTVKNLYYTVNSSVALPGEYVIVLDFSTLNMTEEEWADARVLKRSDVNTAWEEISHKVISRKTDGLTGKLVIGGLTGFSHFAIGAMEVVLSESSFDLSAYKIGEVVNLKWTLHPVQLRGDFTIQHSSDGIHFMNIGTLVNHQGSTNSFNHSSPIQGNNYYRVMYRDHRDKIQISNTRIVNITGNQNRLVIYGNPVTGVVNLGVSEQGTILLKSMDGRTLVSQPVVKGRNQINVQHLTAGTYIISFKNKVAKIIVQ